MTVKFSWTMNLEVFDSLFQAQKFQLVDTPSGLKGT